ncbi:MAG: HAD-IC family P-type ATPase [Chloroflexi bacterium]|nr:HAD-IC family P-type ATPase [Chloroflexota bacterium]
MSDSSAPLSAVSINGLSTQEVTERRAKGLGNSALPPTGRTYAQIVRENVFTFINIVIFVLAVALILVGRASDALVSVGVISLNIAVSVVQEIRAKRTLDQIALLTRPTATVVRDGQERSVPPEELVVGDVLKVGPGDQIVLDGRVIGDGKMQVDESQLTGESNLIPKQAGDGVFSGSFCVNGSALFVVEKVGTQSLANEITAGARAFRRVLTPLQNEVYLVVRIMLVIVIYLEFLLFLNSVINNLAASDSIADATLVVGLVPNGLFLSISVAYALGAVRIIRFGALVQQSNAIESLSNVDVLCLDKTGTLTANRLKVDDVYPIDFDKAQLQHILGTMVASAATLNKTAEAVAAAYKADRQPVLADVPFSSARKWSAVAFQDSGLYAMGAPEMLQPYLDGASEVDSELWQSITAQSSQLTDQGLRVLLVAHHPDGAQLQDNGDESKLPAGMRPIGLLSLSDELRPEAKETLEAFIKSGVQPKIISGDNPETVYALAKQAGLGEGVNLVSGIELQQMTDDQFNAAASSATIFGRITPQQKEHLVDALKQHGHYVAMIGDGVNDVLSLKKANLGISMQSGSQATRAVADIVLMKDSFAALAPAVQEGQRIVNGMQDILRLFLTRILTMALLIVSSLIIGVFPLALRHGSLVTLLSVGIPAVMLALWARPGQTLKGSMVQRLANFVLTPVLFTSAIGLMVFYAALLLPISGPLAPANLSSTQIAQQFASAIPLAQTTLTSFLVVTGLLLVVFVEPPIEWLAGGDVPSGDWRPTVMAGGLLLAFTLISIVPSLRNVFALATLDPLSVGIVTVGVVVWFFVVRFVWRRHIITRFLGMKIVQ